MKESAFCKYFRNVKIMAPRMENQIKGASNAILSVVRRCSVDIVLEQIQSKSFPVEFLIVANDKIVDEAFLGTQFLNSELLTFTFTKNNITFALLGVN